MAFAWTTKAQLTSGTLTLNDTDRIWLNGAAYGDNVNVGSYQDSTHISNNTDVHTCTTNHVHNTKWLTSGTVSLDGGGSVAVNTITAAQCPLDFQFTDGVTSIATSNGKFYAYDGTTDTVHFGGDTNPVTFYAFQQSNASWSDANTSTTPLTLADQSSAVDHHWYVAISASPTNTGAKTGKVKISITYV